MSEGLTKDDQEVLGYLRKVELKSPPASKRYIQHLFRPQIPSNNFSEPLKSLFTLLVSLFCIALEAEDAIDQGSRDCQALGYEVGGKRYWEALDKICETYFHRYTDATMQFLDSLDSEIENS